MSDSVGQFRDAIRSAGLVPPEAIDADGKLHRFASNGKRGDDAGFYVLHAEGIPAGSFGDWRTGLSQSWQADLGRSLTPAEEAAHRTKLDTMRRERDAEQAKRKAKAEKKATAIWKAAKPATANHAYLTRKGIKAHGARQHHDALVIPMHYGGELQSLQFIGPDGNKRFLTGGRVAGCYFSMGNPEGAAAWCIAEGFATGATIHEATGYPVAVAFYAGNLEPVAQALRSKLPELRLIVCADDDAATEGNPGITMATAAARSVGGLVAIPDFGNDRAQGATDFNDMAQHCGLEAVEQAVARASAPQAPEHQPDAVRLPALESETPGVPGNAAQATGTGKAERPIPGATDRPAFRVFDDWLETAGERFKPGVWHFGTDNEGNTTQAWVCSPLHVEAVTFDEQDNNFGRLLRFRNTLKRWRQWAMPMELLRGAGDEMRGELLAMGVEIDPTTKARNLLATYLQARPPTRRINCAMQVGWCGNSFVLPEAVIGPNASGVIFQSGERGHEAHTTKGTLEGWQAGIAARAVGNPMLVLALSASFAGPMLARCNAEGGGLHYVGDSSSGKTTAIEAACATWGGPSFRRSWRATANGMEGAAALFNDCLLALDEISECDPREVGAIVYALGNGIGKQRAGRTGKARPITRWRCFVLSSGERTIGTTMLEGGHRAKAGQSVRLLDIAAARTFGTWDNLHDLPSGQAFSDAIKRESATHYGHAGRAFLEKLSRDDRDFCTLLERLKALPAFCAKEGEGQDRRAAARFALLAIAGEVATEYGISRWPEGEAIQAAAECFKAWQATRGRGNDERRQILERVSSFIERHGDGRFSSVDAPSEPKILDRAGWWSDSSEGRGYLFTADGLREALKGFDFKRALDVLQSSEVLPKPQANGERARFFRIGGRGAKLYAIDSSKLTGNDRVA
ncbi:MAG: DUF927 domain-containing protein [Burkholderiales bacterium]|nr:DUF927 domain-containing protein [Burkholderiales bacterium]